jgi:hypothetical protein
MLTGKPTAVDINATIHRTIVELLEWSGRQPPDFDDSDDLVSIGLTSLDLAALVAKLQRHWKIDPFLEANTITEVRTVGDFYRVYRECIGPV